MWSFTTSPSREQLFAVLSLDQSDSSTEIAGYVKPEVRCDVRGFTCLMGIPATTEHLVVCNETVRRAADLETGKQLAVALLAAAAHTCE